MRADDHVLLSTGGGLANHFFPALRVEEERLAMTTWRQIRTIKD